MVAVSKGRPGVSAGTSSKISHVNASNSFSHHFWIIFASVSDHRPATLDSSEIGFVWLADGLGQRCRNTLSTVTWQRSPDRSQPSGPTPIGTFDHVMQRLRAVL